MKNSFSNSVDLFPSTSVLQWVLFLKSILISFMYKLLLLSRQEKASWVQFPQRPGWRSDVCADGGSEPAPRAPSASVLLQKKFAGTQQSPMLSPLAHLKQCPRESARLPFLRGLPVPTQM